MQKRHELVRDLRELYIVSRGSVKLSSGKESNIFVDMMPALTHPAILKQVGELIGFLAEDNGLRQVAGPGVAGALLVAAALFQPPIVPATVMQPQLPRISNGFVLNTEKNQIEGWFDHRLDTLLLDDVATTGGTLLRMARTIREAGGSVASALVVVNREEGAYEALAAQGIFLFHMLTLRDLEAGA